MHRAPSCLFVACLLLTAHAAESPHPQATGEATDMRAWPLVFRDEFDGDTLDEHLWSYRTGSRYACANLPQNVSVSNGSLRVALKKELVGTLSYSAGGIISRTTYGYGFYEARFRCPGGAGWHTSFWLMRNDGAQAKAAGEAIQEIDVCEQDSDNRHQFAPNLHQWLPTPHRGLGHKNIDVSPDLSQGFHVWGCLFLPDRLSFFFDGSLVHTIDPTGIRHGPQNIWLTAIAAPLGGSKAVDDASLPTTAEFDYVRHWAAPVALPPALHLP